LAFEQVEMVEQAQARVVALEQVEVLEQVELVEAQARVEVLGQVARPQGALEHTEAQGQAQVQMELLEHV
jgi:hypothetical protein